MAPKNAISARHMQEEHPLEPPPHVTLFEQHKHLVHPQSTPLSISWEHHVAAAWRPVGPPVISF